METAYGQIHGIFCEQRPGCHGIHGINVEKFAGRTHEAQSVQDVENLYAGRDCARNRLLLNRLVLNILTMLLLVSVFLVSCTEKQNNTYLSISQNEAMKLMEEEENYVESQ